MAVCRASPRPGHSAASADQLPALVDESAGLVPRTATVPQFGEVVDADLAPARPSLPPLRRNARVSKPPRRPDWLIGQLPVGMLQGDFFVRFVSIFQELAESLLEGADLVDHLVDATVTPVPMVSHLASWIGVEAVDVSLPEHLQRVILASSSRALAHRGTRRGLQGYLEMLSGGAAEVSEGGGVWPSGHAPGDVAWLKMTVAGTGHLSEDEFAAIVRDEIPAHVRAELWVGDRRILSTVEEEW